MHLVSPVDKPPGHLVRPRSTIHGWLVKILVYINNLHGAYIYLVNFLNLDYSWITQVKTMFRTNTGAQTVDTCQLFSPFNSLINAFVTFHHSASSSHSRLDGVHITIPSAYFRAVCSCIFQNSGSINCPPISSLYV